MINDDLEACVPPNAAKETSVEDRHTYGAVRMVLRRLKRRSMTIDFIADQTGLDAHTVRQIVVRCCEAGVCVGQLASWGSKGPVIQYRHRSGADAAEVAR